MGQIIEALRCQAADLTLCQSISKNAASNFLFNYLHDSLFSEDVAKFVFCPSQWGRKRRKSANVDSVLVHKKSDFAEERTLFRPFH